MGKSAILFAAVSLSALAALPAAAQPNATAYHAPHNAWGQPDLQGTYTTATITPVTRDAKYGTRNVLTKEEAFKPSSRPLAIRSSAPMSRPRRKPRSRI